MVMELIKELLKAIAEYSQLNREEFIETVRKAQTSQQSSENTRLKSRLSEAQKRVQDLEKLLCRIDVYKRQLAHHGTPGKSRGSYSGR